MCGTNVRCTVEDRQINDGVDEREKHFMPLMAERGRRNIGSKMSSWENHVA